MSTLLVYKEQLQALYAKYAQYINKVLQFILALLVFGLINSNIGYMKLVSSAIATIGLSVICAFLPLIVLVVLASALILVQMFSLSLAALAVTGLVFFIMYVFYFRFTPDKAWIVLLTPIAFALKIPYVIPIALGLVGTPVCAVPVACGTIVYYMLHYVKTSSATLKGSGAASMIANITTFAKQLFQNKEMWVMTAALVLSLVVVNFIRTKSADHSWRIAVGAGVILNIVIVVIGDVTFNIHIAYLPLILTNILAVGVGLAMEFLFFTVDYTRTERMQFEDDEYYYYVKAVPKITISVPEKTVKKINERQNTETIDAADIKKVVEKQKQNTSNIERKKTVSKNAIPKGKITTHDETDKELLERSLKKDLGLK
ncbi:MAG: MARVEL domain-containing protein [Hespellia sp.]|nr:MARVEL domain-containing protein [Hespellia sp.]